MSDLAEVIDTLWMYATDAEDPLTVERAFQAIQPFGDAALDGVISALQQNDLNLCLLSLRVLREFEATPVELIPALENSIGSSERLARMTAMETAGLKRAAASCVAPAIRRHLNSDDDLERVVAAGNYLRITKAEEASKMLRELLANEDVGVAMSAVFYLREGEWADQPPPDNWL